MSQPLLNITRDRCASGSGVVTVKLVVPDDVLSYTDPTAEAGVTVKPGAEIYHIEIDPRTGFHREELRDGSHGEYHEQRIGFDLRKLRQSVATLRRRLRHKRVHIIFTDENEETYLYLNHRLRTATADNPTSGKNGTRLEFRGASVLPATHFQGILLPPPPGEIEGGDAEFGDVPFEDPADGGGVPGGGPEDEIGGGDPPPGTGGGTGGGGDTGVDPAAIRFLQPTTGDYWRILIDECGMPYTIPE